ncbi:MAG TPA: hypothetical protein VIJ22_19200 [Polyangiaceae bacterium]
MRALAALVTSLALSLPSAAGADESHAPPDRKSGWFDLFATAFVGDGLRFNNPYRLSTVLGSQAQSLSRTAAYTDLGGAILIGNPAFLAHGLVLRASVALEGIEQAVLAPSYMVLHRFGPWAAYGRAGAPIVLSPDTTFGMEGAAGAIWFVRAGIGLAAEVVGDVFYGAGTREVETPAYPVLSAQAGLWLSWEVLP